MGPDQFPSPFKLKPIFDSSKKQNNLVNVSRSETSTPTPISKPPSHLTPTHSFLNLHHDSHITINNDTTGSILKFQTQDAENVIDWIDSLKSRFHDLKNSQDQELNELIDKNDEINKIEKLKEEYKSMHFDEDFVKLGKLLHEQNQEDMNNSDDMAEEQEDAEEEEQDIISDDELIQIISDEDDIIEIQDEEDDHEEQARNSQQESQIQQFDYSQFQSNPYSAYGNDNITQLPQYQQEIEYDDEPEDEDEDEENEEEQSHHDFDDENAQQQTVFDYNLHNQLNNQLGYGITQVPSYNVTNGRPRLSDTYNYRSELNIEESDDVEEDNEEDEENNYFAQQGNEEEPIELESTSEEEEEEEEEGVDEEVEEESEGEPDAEELEDEELEDEHDDAEELEDEHDDAEELEDESDNEPEDEVQQSINESAIEGYEAGLDDEEEDVETEEANQANVYYSNTDLLSLAASAILQNNVHEHKLKHAASGYMADSEFTDNKTTKEEPDNTTNDEAEYAKVENDDFASEEIAPVPDPFYAHELSEEKMIADKEVDEYISEGSLADESQFESMKDDVNMLPSDIKTDNPIEELSSDEEPPLPIFKTIEEEDPEVVLEKLKETEKKYHIKLNAVEDLEREIKSSSRDVTIMNADGDQNVNGQNDDQMDIDSMEGPEEVESDSIDEVIDPELQAVMQTPIDDIANSPDNESSSLEEEEELTIIEPPPVRDYILPVDSINEEEEDVEEEPPIDAESNDESEIVDKVEEIPIKTDELTAIESPKVKDTDVLTGHAYEVVDLEPEEESTAKVNFKECDNESESSNDEPGLVNEIPVPVIEPIFDEDSSSVEYLDELHEENESVVSGEHKEASQIVDDESQEQYLGIQEEVHALDDVIEEKVQEPEQGLETQKTSPPFENHDMLQGSGDASDNEEASIKNGEIIDSIKADDITVPEIETIVEEQDGEDDDRDESTDVQQAQVEEVLPDVPEVDPKNTSSNVEDQQELEDALSYGVSQDNIIPESFEDLMVSNYEEIRIESEIENSQHFVLPVVEIGEHNVYDIVENLVQQLEDQESDEESSREEDSDESITALVEVIECPQLEEIDSEDEETGDSNESDSNESGPSGTTEEDTGSQQINQEQQDEEEIPSIIIEDADEKENQEEEDQNFIGDGEAGEMQESAEEIDVNDSRDEQNKDAEHRNKEVDENEEPISKDESVNSVDLQVEGGDIDHEEFIGEPESMDVDPQQEEAVDNLEPVEASDKKHSIEHEDESPVKRFKSAITSFFSGFKGPKKHDITGITNEDKDIVQEFLDDVMVVEATEEDNEPSETENDLDIANETEDDSVQIHLADSTDSNMQFQDCTEPKLDDQLDTSSENSNSGDVAKNDANFESPEEVAPRQNENPRVLFLIPEFTLLKRPAIKRRHRRRRHIRLTPNFLNREELEQALEFSKIEAEDTINQQENHETGSDTEVGVEIATEESKEEMKESEIPEMEQPSNLEEKVTKDVEQQAPLTPEQHPVSEMEVLDIPKLRQKTKLPEKPHKKKHVLGLDLDEVPEPVSPRKTRDGSSYGQEQHFQKRRLRSHDKKRNISDQPSPVLQQFDTMENKEDDESTAKKESKKRTKRTRRKTSEDIKDKPASRTRSKSPLKETMSEIIEPLEKASASKSRSHDKRVSSLGSGKPYDDDSDRGRSRDR